MIGRVIPTYVLKEGYIAHFRLGSLILIPDFEVHALLKYTLTRKKKWLWKEYYRWRKTQKESELR